MHDFADIPYFSPHLVNQDTNLEDLYYALPGEELGDKSSMGKAEKGGESPVEEKEAGDGMSRGERARLEAKSLEHMTLHSCKNGMCEFCMRGRMLKHYTHSKHPEDPDEPDEYKKPTAFGQLISADKIIASEQNRGSGGERMSLHVRDHYSGMSVSYPNVKGDEESVYKSLKEYGGIKLNGSSSTVLKSDNADEIINAAGRLCWVPDKSLANRWPHNAAIERDIRTTKERTRPAHLQAGFLRGLWPVSLDFAAKARSFFEPAPIYDWEIGTEAEEDKKGKTRFQGCYWRRVYWSNVSSWCTCLL